MTIEERNELFGILCGMTDHQVDPIVKTRLKSFAGRPHADIKDELLGLLDDIVYGSLTSDFEVMALTHIWKACGGSDEELAERNAMLNDPTRRDELKARFKWQGCHYGR